MIVGIVIGVGIFKAPSIVAANAGTPAAFIALWVIGGAISLIGALCYAELGSSHPNAGGEYYFLSRAYGDWLGFLFAWARMTVIQTGAIAAIAFVFADYATALLPLGRHSSALYAGLAVIGVTAVNIVGTTKRVNSVPIESPLAITRPMLKRDTAPAPLAVIKGTTPSTIAAVVIRIGRSRIAAACSMASRLERPLSCSSLANSTMRIACLLINPISVTRPTSV